MVMGKVSKAIAASFLCLLFNGSGTTTNAMNLETTNNLNNPEVIINNQPNPEFNNKQENLGPEMIKINNKLENAQDNLEGEQPGGIEDNKKTNILHIIIPVATGVGGFVLGAILGKFVF